MNDCDRKWIDALKPYVADGLLPLYRLDDGTLDAAATIARFCQMHEIVP
jgi:hypothetical protein